MDLRNYNPLRASHPRELTSGAGDEGLEILGDAKTSVFAANGGLHHQKFSIENSDESPSAVGRSSGSAHERKRGELRVRISRRLGTAREHWCTPEPKRNQYRQRPQMQLHGLRIILERARKNSCHD